MVPVSICPVEAVVLYNTVVSTFAQIWQEIRTAVTMKK